MRDRPFIIDMVRMDTGFADRLLGFMGLERRSGWGLANPSPELSALFGSQPTAAGVSVTAETALTSPTALAACSAIYQAVGGLPFHLFRKNPDGTRERDTEHPAAAILSGDWCPWAGGAETRAALQLDALLHGHAAGLLIRVGGTVREIHRLDPRTFRRDTTGPEPVFRARINNTERPIDWRDVLYLPTPGSTDSRLINLTHNVREAIGIEIVMAQHQGSLFANGGFPGGVLKHPKTMKSPEVLQRLRAQFATLFGPKNSGKPLILEEGMDWQQVTFSSVDMQFLELRRFAVEEIARGYRVPQVLVGDLSRATWRNVEELSRLFVQTTLMPWAEVWQAALERTLLSPEERSTYYVEPVFDDLLRGDTATRFNAYRQATGGAWMTRNEIRGRDNLPPVAGGDELILQAGQGDGAPISDGNRSPAPDNQANDQVPA